MLLGRDRQRVQRPLLAQALPVDRYNQQNRTKELKDGTRQRQNKPEEALKTLCLKHRDIR
jgi:hypothetical protein